MDDLHIHVTVAVRVPPGDKELIAHLLFIRDRMRDPAYAAQVASDIAGTEVALRRGAASVFRPIAPTEPMNEGT